MFKGFNLECDWDRNDELYKECFLLGQISYKNNNSKIDSVLSSFKNSDDSLNGSKMRANWFPIIDVDVFISHSHKDENIAMALSGLLKKHFRITSFIDSCVWKHAKKLQKLIDDDLCIIEKNLYDYNLINHSAAHVNMMLLTALATMIDKTECVIFLNTPDSIIPSKKIDQTLSPWIYSEIVMTQLIRKKSLEEHRSINMIVEKTFSETRKDVRITHDVNLDHLENIDIDTLNEWIEYNSNNKFDALNKLYEIVDRRNYE